MKNPLLLSSFFLLTACFDSDKDGLTDAEEAEMGTDPEKSDSDGDGLDDLFEHENGLNPTSIDSDGDGCADGKEQDAGSDATDASDTSYKGNWPCNPDIEEMTDPGWSGTADVGSIVPRYVATDQNDEMVDLYDFAGENFILLDLSGDWCFWCHMLAQWLDGQHDGSDYQNYFAPSFSGQEWYTRIPELVEEGKLTWVTVMDSGTAQEWYDLYPNPKVPIFNDASSLQMSNWLSPQGYPFVILISPDMEVIEVGSYDRVFKRTLAWYDANNPSE